MISFKKKFISLVVACSMSVLFCHAAPMEKKKILILTSTGGGGHLAVSNSLEQQLKSNYNVSSVNIFQDLLQSLDPIRFLTFNRYSAEDLYNMFLPNKHFRVLSLFYYFGIWYLSLRSNTVKEVLRDYCIQEKPGLIISVVPLVNNIILEVAQELNIPFLLIPTDLDIRMYIRNINRPTYQQFKICLPFDDEEIIQPLKDAHIDESQIAFVGAPLKQDFFTRKNRHSLKSELDIPKNKPVIMILMGAQGSQEIEKFTENLKTINQPIHLIICIGKNEESKKALSALTIPDHISFSVVGFTTRIADYMAVSDLLITKSGTLSVCEAIYMNLPMLLDATSAVLPWEQFNHTFVKKHNFGDSISETEQIEPIVSELLRNKGMLMEYQRNLMLFKKKNNPQEIKKIIKEMLQ